jgi:hypothetical protein
MARSTGTLASIAISLGEQAHALAIEHRAQLDPRLPSGTIDGLDSDLQTLGVSRAAPPSASVESPPPPQAPSPAEALAIAVNLVTAIHDTILGARAKPAVRKAYAVASKPLSNEARPILAATKKIVAQATANPSEALALGILPADITALQAAESDLLAAEAAAAHGDGAQAGPTKKEKRAAEARMLEAVSRIAGAGALAFAQNAAVRAQFETLKPEKKG